MSAHDEVEFLGNVETQHGMAVAFSTKKRAMIDYQSMRITNTTDFNLDILRGRNSFIFLRYEYTGLCKFFIPQAPNRDIDVIAEVLGELFPMIPKENWDCKGFSAELLDEEDHMLIKLAHGV